MIDRISCYITDNTWPYENLAVEEYLLRHVEPGECILYLWQNRNTVVIGRNQNYRSEVRLNPLQEDGGFLVRRLSGGGAVYHDLGNLNFTFFARKDDFDIDRQSSVILEMVRLLGLEAEKTGRNDILIDGKKFSGNAYYNQGGASYHHGTIMIDVDKTPLEKYLNVPIEKLESKGVSSVRSRVVNLKELLVDISVETVKERMVDAFEKVYGLNAEMHLVQGLPGGTASPERAGELDFEEVQALTEKFRSKEWIYGKEFPFSFKIERRFPWGGVEILLRLEDGKIQDCEIFSDAMDSQLILDVQESLKGAGYNKEDINMSLDALGEGASGEIEDIRKLLLEL